MIIKKLHVEIKMKFVMQQSQRSHENCSLLMFELETRNMYYKTLILKINNTYVQVSSPEYRKIDLKINNKYLKNVAELSTRI
jgi:hypothetical protein